MTRESTVITVDKDVLPLFNELRAREAGRRGKSSITQSNYLRFLLALYKEVESLEDILEAARKNAGERSSD